VLRSFYMLCPRWMEALAYTSAKVAIVLPQTHEGGKNIGAILKVLSQGVSNLKVAYS
jgi:hypothetical protein